MTRPVYRYLRGYCLDPGFSTRLDTANINEVVYRIPFEPLAPGPALAAWKRAGIKPKLTFLFIELDIPA